METADRIFGALQEILIRLDRIEAATAPSAELFTVEETAGRLRVKPQTIYGQIRTGRILPDQYTRTASGRIRFTADQISQLAGRTP